MLYQCFEKFDDEVSAPRTVEADSYEAAMKKFCWVLIGDYSHEFEYEFDIIVKGDETHNWHVYIEMIPEFNYQKL